MEFGRRGGIEGGGEWEGDPEVEIEMPGIPGQIKIGNVHTIDEVFGIIAQLMDNRILTPENFVLASGFAVEFITGVKRDHHDLDLIVFDDELSKYLQSIGLDIGTPKSNWASLDLNPKFIKSTKVTRNLIFKGESIKISALNPSILLVQKCTTAFGREPREKDVFDSRNLINWIASRSDSEIERYYQIMVAALKSVSEMHRQDTIDRINRLINS